MTVKRIGILGGGQLGMYSAEAAKKLGITPVIYSDTSDICADKAADTVIIAPYNDHDHLKEFAEQCDVITYEFENIPVETVKILAQYTPVYPKETLLEIAQDRIAEKTFLNTIGIPTAPWQAVHCLSDLEQVFETLENKPLFIKTTRFGYDGKGQMKLDQASQIETVWNELTANGCNTLIAESCVDYDREISVIVGRDHTGHMVTYGPMHNTHKNHILHETLYPAGLNDDLAQDAVQKTKTLAAHIDLRGVLCLEMFVTRDNRILANEIAPRTHNSGHWTLDGCDVSQFETHIRAVCGMPLKDPAPRPTRMLNLIGHDITDAADHHSGGVLHNYGKKDIKAGRKMGHINFVTT